MKLNKTKIQKAIDGTQKFLDNCTNRAYSINGNITIFGCEMRNLDAYKTMLEYDTTEELKDFDEFHYSLYKAI